MAISAGSRLALALMAVAPLACREPNPAYEPVGVVGHDGSTGGSGVDGGRDPDGSPNLGVARAPDGPGPEAAVPPDAARPPDAGPTISASGLIGYWRFEDDPASGVIRDSSAAGNHGRPRNLAQGARVAGRLGSALQLDGATTYVEIPASPSIDGIDGSLTLAGWINLTALPSDFATLASRQNGTGNYEHFGVSVYMDGRALVAIGGDATMSDTCRAGMVRTGRWVHIAGVLQAPKVGLYVDGVNVCTTTTTRRPRKDTNPVLLGANRNGSFIDEIPKGQLDEIVLYDRALTEAEIRALAAGAAPAAR